MTAVARPQVGAPARWEYPPHSEHVLSNGVQVVFFHLPGQHVVSTRLAISAPLWSEPRSREGVATIVTRTMDEGTQSRSADEMAEALEVNGIALSAGMLGSGMLVDLDATADHAERGWQLTTEFLSEPAFDAGEVGRHVHQRLAEIEQELADPGGRAALEWARSFYTDSSRGSRPTAGRASTVAGITSADCRQFHAASVRPSNATVVVAGDMDRAQALTSLERTIGRWAQPAPARGAADASPSRDEVRTDPDRILFVHRPGAVQTQIHLGSLGPDRRVDGGWAPYPVLGFLIGGSPTSRLDSVLREDKGFTYGMRAGFRSRSHDGVFTVSGAVRGDSTAESVDLILGILAEAGKGFTEDELHSAADFIGKTAPVRYATADVVAGEAGALRLDGLDSTFVTDYLAQLSQLTTDDLARAWSLWSDQPRSIVLVGDAEAGADAVKALGRGEVEVVE
ncbi:M16 family metallopeptidase [Leekyejoonella antrihumi]|uniref:Insulinase family protein n=1 Tax=Leekyejoonella antrihumi TaxID=1660198 RepID=A0A563DYE6_9MICO|nr:pitrilysin family protein [Leekyejoonella antrihumi]TWP35280.1 insulinase family protein [Leekyejoonella antrihumi]